MKHRSQAKKFARPAPVAREMIVSGLYHSRQVPNKRRESSRNECRNPTDNQS